MYRYHIFFDIFKNRPHKLKKLVDISSKTIVVEVSSDDIVCLVKLDVVYLAFRKNEETCSMQDKMRFLYYLQTHYILH